jgi:hypothetical protein
MLPDDDAGDREPLNPYAPPQAPLASAATPTTSLGQLAQIAIVCAFAPTVVRIPMSFGLLGGIAVNEWVTFGVIALAAAGFSWFLWLYQLAKRVYPCWRSTSNVTTARVVLAYWVPLASLWIPRRHLLELWRLTRSPKRADLADNQWNPINVFWAFHVLSSFVIFFGAASATVGGALIALLACLGEALASVAVIRALTKRADTFERYFLARKKRGPIADERPLAAETEERDLARRDPNHAGGARYE